MNLPTNQPTYPNLFKSLFYLQCCHLAAALTWRHLYFFDVSSVRDCFLNTSLFFCQLQLISFSYLGNDSSAVLRRLPSNLAFSLEVLLNQFLLLFGIVALSVRLGQVFILACVESLQTHLVDFLQNLRSVIDTQLFEKLLDVGRSFTRHCSLRRS